VQRHHVWLETLGYTWCLSLCCGERWRVSLWGSRGIHLTMARTIAGPIVLSKLALYQGCSPLVETRSDAVTVDARVAPHTSASSRVEGRRAGCRWRVSNSALSIAEWVHNSTVATFPAPATSNAACGFPALRFPARFMPRVMGPIRLGALSAVGGAPGSC
jgi:hypothetical protein